MIIRQLALRQARRVLCPSSARPWIRALSSEVDGIRSSLEHSTTETHSIESQINRQSHEEVAPLAADPAGDYADGVSVADAYHAMKKIQKNTAHLGTAIAPYYQPHTLLSRPPSVKDVTLELLLASQAHLGHSTSLWNPANQRYIFGVRQGIHVISLDTTAAHLRRAAKVVTGVCERAGLVLFVGTRPGQARAVVNAARLAQGCHLFERWIPGSITNGPQILGRCALRVVDELDRPMAGYDDQLRERQSLKPDLVVCLNPLENYVLLHECGANNIPTVGVIDTDADPTWVTYPIPANDDSLRCIQVIAGVLGNAGAEGQQRRRRAAEQGRVTYEHDLGLRSPRTGSASAEQQQQRQPGPMGLW
ncbi:MAG: 37S ribosomal protein, mitochondrial [Thelocarpon impressellum]|nr:MAG: 37S ribosomal protein, mitochondrial [Thelocarpon impressellum]